METIASKFGELGVTIDNKKIQSMEKLAVHFVLRDMHPATFNGMYLGVDPVVFKPSDRNALFDVFGIHESDLAKKIREIPSIDRDRKVQSDPFNLLSLWIVHLAFVYIKNETVRHEFMMNVLRYYHYKLFTSIVNNMFRHGANRGVMEATIAHRLTLKSDIVRFESWRDLIDSHCEKIINVQDRYYKAVVSARPDEAFLSVISESQTALRQKIRTFASAYYDAHESGATIGSRSSIAENADGEKIIAQTASVVDSVRSTMVAEILNPNLFINETDVKLVAKEFSTINYRWLKIALLKVNETAAIQAASRKFDKVQVTRSETIYIGVRTLVEEIIKSVVSTCRLKRVSLSNHAEVFDTMRKTYTASRIQDPTIVNVKRSIAHLIDPFNITTNEASKSALRLGVIYYIIYRTIAKMKV